MARHWFMCYTEVRIPAHGEARRTVSLGNSVTTDHPLLAVRRWQQRADERAAHEGRIKYLLNWFTELSADDVTAYETAISDSITMVDVTANTHVAPDS